MKPPSEKQAVSRIVELLDDLFEGSSKIKVRHVGSKERYDYAISAGNYHFLAEYKSNASASAVSSAIGQLSGAMEGRNLPLVVVPYMGPVGHRLCDRSKTSWVDLCGNAKIVAPGLRIWIEGRPNQYRQRGRPPNVFASKSSRIARQLLLDSSRFQTQSELARSSGLGDGYVSKIVRRLEREQYLEVDDRRAVRPRDPDLLLDAWRDVYDFSRHSIIRGHIPSRTGEELVDRIVRGLRDVDFQWALTGLSAAWRYAPFAAFRLATVYLSSAPTRLLLSEMAFTEEPKGANTWLVLPDDEGVFQGAETIGGAPCASAVQTYLDLKAQPERAAEAADALRKERLHWRRHGG